MILPTKTWCFMILVHLELSTTHQGYSAQLMWPGEITCWTGGEHSACKSTNFCKEIKTNPPDVCNEIPFEEKTLPAHVHPTRPTVLSRFERRGYKGIFKS